MARDLLDASYWFSKAIDLGSDFTATATSGGLSRSVRNQSASVIFEDLRGLSAFDQSHAFFVAVSYETPSLSNSGRWVSQLFGQWDMSAVVLLKTGTPFTVISGSDSPGFGNVDGSRGDRPHVIDTSVLGTAIAHPDDAEKLPASAFAFITLDDDRGNLGRNTFRKDGISNINAALSRTWRVRSGEHAHVARRVNQPVQHAAIRRTNQRADLPQLCQDHQHPQRWKSVPVSATLQLLAMSRICRASALCRTVLVSAALSLSAIGHGQSVAGPNTESLEQKVQRLEAENQQLRKEIEGLKKIRNKWFQHVYSGGDTGASSDARNPPRTLGEGRRSRRSSRRRGWKHRG